MSVGMEGRTTALVLAGKRDGATDPLARGAGVTHKCLVPVVGQPMLVHVIDALAASDRIGQIRVAIEEPAVLDQLPQLRGLIATGRLAPVAAQPNLVDSVLAAADGATFPLLITTADNVLLTPDSVAEMLEGCKAQGADAAVAFTRREPPPVAPVLCVPARERARKKMGTFCCFTRGKCFENDPKSVRNLRNFLKIIKPRNSHSKFFEK